MIAGFENFKYDQLNNLQVGRIGEYWAKIWLTLHNLEVYHSDVDNKGIDFIIRLNDSKHIDIQVKTVRENTPYVYVNKRCWKNELDDGLRDNLFLVLVMLINNQIPHIFFIPSMVWKTPNKLFSDRNYEGKNSLPDWGINLSMKNLPLLTEYDISSFINWINRI